MLKKIFLILTYILFINQAGFSAEIPLKIKPVSNITTSNLRLQNGDCIEFTVAENVIIDKKIEFNQGQRVYATITSREENGFMNQIASLYIENFYTKDCSGKKNKLKGIVYKEGRSHDVINGFLPIVDILIRGGEVQIKPDKDSFTIYLEQK